MVTPTLDTPFGAPPGTWWLDVEYPCRSEPRSFLADRVVSVCRPGDSLGRRLGRMVCIICKDRPVRAWVADQPANPGRGQFAPPPRCECSWCWAGPHRDQSLCPHSGPIRSADAARPFVAS
jgi:hypothetical protein